VRISVQQLRSTGALSSYNTADTTMKRGGQLCHEIKASKYRSV